MERITTELKNSGVLDEARVPPETRGPGKTGLGLIESRLGGGRDANPVRRESKTGNDLGDVVYWLLVDSTLKIIKDQPVVFKLDEIIGNEATYQGQLKIIGER